MRGTPLERFWPKVRISGTHWLWTAYIRPDGYGGFRADDVHTAHRFSYQHFVGPIPEGLVIDHLCRVRNCVNPDHLEAVTQAENSYRKAPIRRIGNDGLWHFERDMDPSELPGWVA